MLRQSQLLGDEIYTFRSECGLEPVFRNNYDLVSYAIVYRHNCACVMIVLRLFWSYAASAGWSNDQNCTEKWFKIVWNCLKSLQIVSNCLQVFKMINSVANFMFLLSIILKNSPAHPVAAQNSISLFPWKRKKKTNEMKRNQCIVRHVNCSPSISAVMQKQLAIIELYKASANTTWSLLHLDVVFLWFFFSLINWIMEQWC